MQIILGGLLFCCTLYVLSHSVVCMLKYYIRAVNPLTANCRIYPAQQEYCIRQLPHISGYICLVHIGTWRQEYFVSVVYNF